MFEQKAPFIFFLAICHISALLIFLMLILRVGYFVFSKKYTNRAEKIGAIAIVSFFFNDTLQQAILTPINVLVTNLQKLFYITYAYSSIDDSSSVKEITEIMEDYPLNVSIISVDHILNTFPIASLFTCASMSILLYFSLVSLKKYVVINETHKPVSRGNKDLYIYNTIISSILILSLFLVISVCIAIPYLSQASKPTAFTIARLDTVLNDYSSKDSLTIVGISTNPFPESSVKELIFTDTVINEYKKLNDKDKQRIDNIIETFEQMYSHNKAERFKTISNLEKLKTTYKERENTYKKNLSVNFEKVTQSIIIDKGELFQSSVSLFNDFVVREKNGFENTLQSVYSSDARNIIAKQEAINQIKDAILELGKNDKRDNFENSYGSLYDLIPNFLSYQSYIADNPTASYIPTFEKNGSEWGFFGFMAKYLIKTQSSELVLLMGMFGFGLLGASLLSFNQTNNNDHFIDNFKTTPLISNFGNVLARGFGAALVIYLATKGGLAIFSAGTSTDANGYILLLTCFVGAAYSERVWSRIRKSLYPDDNNKDGYSKMSYNLDKFDESLQTKQHQTPEVTGQNISEKQNPKP